MCWPPIRWSFVRGKIQIAMGLVASAGWSLVRERLNSVDNENEKTAQ